MLTPALINALNSFAVICLAVLVFNIYHHLNRLERAMLELSRYASPRIGSAIRRALSGKP